MKRNIFLSVLAVLLMQTSSFSQDLPRSASFGAAVSDLNDSSRAALRLSSLSGSLINKVIAGGSAEKAGFRANDVLISIDGTNIENTTHFLTLLKKYHGDDKVKIAFYREAKRSAVTMLLLPRQMETSDAYDIVYSSVVSGSNQLRTIITKPKGGGIHPAVLLISGVGCYSIDNPFSTEIRSIKMWSDSLTRNGFVTMRVEKTGMGDSKGMPCNESDFTTETQAFLAGLKQLKSLPYVDKKDVFIAGFSIGGVIAPLLAEREPVKGIIVYGTAGKNWLEYELDNSLRQQLMADKPADSVDLYMRAEYIRLYGLFVEKKTPEQIMKEHPESTVSFYPYPMRIEYFQQVADVNICGLWMNTKAKVLALHGSSDFVSSAAEHKQIAETVNHYNPGNATYIEIADSDHWSLFTESEIISARHERTQLNPAPLLISIEWLKANS
ncbi:MAG: Pdz domain protein [Bacteroidetes bacterium]|nr:Pdz domain protein [Bacteroidota bacterium]